MNNYYKIYRGKCTKWCEAIAEIDPSVEVVKGFYHCPIDGKEEHTWLRHIETGEIIDPTVMQFKSTHGEYEEWDRKTWDCPNCGERVDIEKAQKCGRVPFCSSECSCAFVGLPYTQRALPTLALVALATIATSTTPALGQYRPTVQDSFARHVGLGGKGVDDAYRIANQWRLDIRRPQGCDSKKKCSSRLRGRTVGQSYGSVHQGMSQGMSQDRKSLASSKMADGSARKSAKQPSGTLPTKSPRPLKVWQRLLLW